VAAPAGCRLDYPTWIVAGRLSGAARSFCELLGRALADVRGLEVWRAPWEVKRPARGAMGRSGGHSGGYRCGRVLAAVRGPVEGD
jgi:hypothetical protein